MLNKEKIMNATILMMIGSIIAKILGFVRDIFLAQIYGVSNIMDAYVVSNTIPNIILACFGVAIANSIVSLFSNKVKEENEEEAKKVLNVANFIMAIISIIIITIILRFTEQIVKMIANGFDNETLNIAISLTRITNFCIIFMALNYVLNGFLQYKNKFFLTSFAGSYSSIIIIIFVLLKIQNIKMYALAWVIGAALQFVTVNIVCKKNGYNFKMQIKDSKNYIKDILYLAVPLMISYSIQQINVIVDKTIASTLFVGAVSALNYANIIIVAITAIFITSIITVQYSKMSKLKTDNQLIIYANDTIDVISLIMMPITIAIILFAKPIIYTLFYGGNFDDTALINTYQALIFYGAGLIFIAYRDILIRVCLVKKNSKLPMVSNIIAVIINIVLNIILSKYLSHLGLALATSISLGISMFILLIMSKINYGKIFNAENIKMLIKICISIIISVIVIVILNNSMLYYIYINKMYTLIYMLLAGSIFIAIYAIILKILKVDYIKIIKNMLKNN